MLHDVQKQVRFCVYDAYLARQFCYESREGDIGWGRHQEDLAERTVHAFDNGAVQEHTCSLHDRLC